MVFQTDNSSWEDRPSASGQVGNSTQDEFTGSQEYTSAGLYVVTLGNPRKACRHFGICKIDEWENGVKIDLSRQCLAKFFLESQPASHLRGVFLKEALSDEVHLIHFRKEFVVQAPYLFDRLKAGNGSLLEVKIMPGHYPIEEGAYEMTVYFDVA